MSPGGSRLGVGANAVPFVALAALVLATACGDPADGSGGGGTQSSSTGGGATTSQGGGPAGCQTVEDCPADEDGCGTPSCLPDGTCGSDPVTLGTPCGAAGAKVCDGEGECVSCVPGDVGCIGSIPRACGSDGEWVDAAPCSGEAPICLVGQCVECVGADDCSSEGECTLPACDAANACTSTPVDGGTACDSDSGICDGSGVCRPCGGGLEDCDMDPANGCEVNTTSDSQHCGACGRSCFGGACVSGQCGPTTLATGTNPWALAVSPTHLYWTNLAGGSVSGVALNGGLPVTITSVSSPNGIALNGTTLFVTSDANRIGSVPSSGGSFGAIITGISAAGIATDGTHLFWGAQSAGTIHRALLNGSSPSTIQTGENWPNQLASDATHLYWINSGNIPGTGALRRRSHSTGAVESLWTGVNGGYGVAVSSTHVYWTHYADGTVSRMPKTGGAAEVMVSNEPEVQGVAVDAISLYWTTSAGNLVRRMRLP